MDYSGTNDRQPKQPREPRKPRIIFGCIGYFGFLGCSSRNHLQYGSRPGYTFLLSVLFVGAIALAVTGTMLMLGWLSLRNAVVLEQSHKAYELAMTCAEHGLLKLFEDNTYRGGEPLGNADGECYLLIIGGSGNEDRSLCSEGTSDSAVRRLEIIIERIRPSIQIFAWQEVEAFSSCSYE